MARLFGTDGVRGIANTELSCDIAFNIGRAMATIITSTNATSDSEIEANTTENPNKHVIVIGKDTRISSTMLEHSVCAGICSAGVDAVRVGVVPTPAVAYIVNEINADAGIMISASHNPFEFNGIKTFGKNGKKLDNTQENQIEEIILDTQQYIVKTGEDIGLSSENPELIDSYINHVIQSSSTKLGGIKILLDCANGSASFTAQKIFKSLEADVTLIDNKPNGININNKCGSTYMNYLSEAVKIGKFDVGFAFDGDADRCLAVDNKGNIVDGDQIIAILANDMHKKGQLKNNTVVATIMSNLGFFEFLQEKDIKFHIVQVGDKYVLESMIQNDYELGGEQSGHVILKKYMMTGDGQTTAVKVLEVMKNTGKSLRALADVMKIFPQTCINMYADSDMKQGLKDCQQIEQDKKELENQLNGKGRIVIRPSGTEPVIRVMVEAETQEITDTIARKMADKIEERLKNNENIR